MVSEGYSPKGLRDIAKYLDELIDGRNLFSQNRLGELSGISSGTIGTLRTNALIVDEIIHAPSIKTLYRLAKHLPDPDRPNTNLTPERLRRVAFGEEPLRAVAQKVIDPVEEISHHYKTDPERFESNGVDSTVMAKVKSRQSLSALELMAIAAATGKEVAEVFKIFGYDPNQPLPPHKPKGRSPDSPQS
jgi:hypothetical protein